MIFSVWYISKKISWAVYMILCEESSFLVYNAMWFGKRLTFRVNILPPVSRSSSIADKMQDAFLPKGRAPNFTVYDSQDCTSLIGYSFENL
jgi:hypothetical protein